MNQFKKIKKNCNKVLLTNEELDAPISNEEGIENSKINVSNNHHVLAIIQENEIKVFFQ